MSARVIAHIVLCALLPAWGFGGEFSQRRAADRQVRMSAAKSLPEAIKRANAPYVAALTGACQWLIGLQAKNDASAVLAEVEGLDDKNQALPDLKKKVEELAAPAVLDEAKQKELATRLKTARKSRAAAIADLAATYYRTGLSRLACDLLQQVLNCDPDNPAARQALGQVHAGTEWKDAFSAQQTQRGSVYVPDMGWVPAAAAERAKNGEWFENGRWLPVEEADKLHAEAAKAWVIETQYFTLKSTASRKQSVQTAERLEGFRQACYRECLDFFLREKRSPQMYFVQASTKKMLVNLFSAKADYDAAIKKEFKAAGAFQAILQILPGFYTPYTHASYFNQATALALPEQLRTIFMQKQVAGQIFSEYAQTGMAGPKPWIGASVCGAMQSAAPDNSGSFSVPSGRQHEAVAKAAEMLKGGNLPPLQTLFTLEGPQFDNPLMPGNTETASALCRFLLETKDGAYALDFLDFVYDSYKGLKSANLGDYIGMDTAALEKEFQAYLKQE